MVHCPRCSFNLVGGECPECGFNPDLDHYADPERYEAPTTVNDMSDSDYRNDMDDMDDAQRIDEMATAQDYDRWEEEQVFQDHEGFDE